MDRLYPTGKIEKRYFRNPQGYFTSIPLLLWSPLPHFLSGGRDFKLTSLRFGTRKLRFGSPLLKFGTTLFHLKINLLRVNYKISDILTENYWGFWLKGVLRKWRGVLWNLACQVLNRKLAVRKWVIGVKRQKIVPFWRKIGAKRRLIEVKKRKFSMDNRSIEVRRLNAEA